MASIFCKYIPIIFVLYYIFIPGCDSNSGKKEGVKSAIQLKNINIVKEAHTRELMSLDGVVGVYVGELEDGTPCIAVMVRGKKPELEKKIGKNLEGYPVRIDETGEIRPMK